MDPSHQSRIAEYLSKVKIPGHYDRVYKDECMFSFDTPLSPGGLYVNLSTLQGFGQEYLDTDFFSRTHFPLYLHETWTRVPLSEEEEEKRKNKPDKMAIGVTGGFQVDKENFKTEKAFQLVLLPERSVVLLPCEGLPHDLQRAITKIQEHESVTSQQQTAAWEEEKPVSRYTEALEQLKNGKKISMNPSEWVCEESGLRENLWLNLSTGYIGSGRPHWDGSGGTGAALKHYDATERRFPLAVKLGTITPSGADVYSYAPEEDCMVTDPLLEQHLRHWGIEMKQMEKTTKTMNEMEVELNLAFEFNRITEASALLEPVSGPCYVGLKNLGNSCYMNAVLQVLWMVPAVRERYLSNRELIFLTASEDPSQDVCVQMAKLGTALVHGHTVCLEGEAVDPDVWSVRPLAFKTLVGRGHSDFSSAHQQDASHYFSHLLEVLNLAEKVSSGRLPEDEGNALTSSMFSFQLEERLCCTESGRVRYNTSTAVILELDIPLEMAVNKMDVEDYKDRQMKRQRLQESGADAEILIEPMENGAQKIVELTSDDQEETVLPRVPFVACLSGYTGDVPVDDYYCQYLQRKTQAIKNTKIKTFPPYLMVQLKRYYVDERWQPKKMEVLVEPPEELQLEGFRGHGPQPNESLQPENEGPESGPVPDAAIVATLTAMGFAANGCRRAALAVNNSSAEAAMEWVLSHMQDPDFDDPIPRGGGCAREPSPETVELIEAMGFTHDSATAALIECQGNTEDAVAWLVHHTDRLDTLVPAILARQAIRSEPVAFLDGTGTYDLIGFISHMGKSTACGHYVCHIKKSGRWILFNDEKVAISASPPRELGYMYLYKRRDIQGVTE